MPEPRARAGRYRCCGCTRALPAARLTVCPTCDGFVCPACPATCPHREPEARQSDYLAFYADDYGTYTPITTDKE
jgi:hypothetical protein